MMSIVESELERRALLGDRRAQDLCAWHGIILPCPCCGDKGDLWNDSNNSYIECIGCGLTMDDTDAYSVTLRWNRRPVPPIGKCGRCKHFAGTRNRDGRYEFCDVDFPSIAKSKENGDCKHYEPREDT